MKLNELLDFQDIVIQCHDNPDADTIASAFGVYQYLRVHGKSPRIIYSGNRRITKSNIKMMVEELEIPIEYVNKLDNPELLITVDCQYGEGNVTHFNAYEVAIIDHHEDCGKDVPLKEIRSIYASCSTLLYVMLTDENYRIKSDIRLSTALYYGLYTDSNYLGEMKHPYDIDLIEDLRVDGDLLERLKNNNFSLQELETAGIALIRYIYDDENHCAIVRSNPCDPNIMGLISDLVLQVDCIDCCIVYCEIDGNFKLSVRSCLKDVRACDLAIYLTENIGNGGGHKKRAGGFINGTKYFEVHRNLSVENYLLNRMLSYFVSYEVVDTAKDQLDITNTRKYYKRPLKCGYVRSTDIETVDTELIIRTMEGDVTICAKDDLYIMIGVNGEVYPITKEELFTRYYLTEESFDMEIEYSPRAKNRTTGKSTKLMSFAKCCIPTGRSTIYAKQLNKTTKVFSKWDYEDYMLGQVNDYIACRSDDIQDIYIINEAIFNKTYILCDEEC